MVHDCVDRVIILRGNTFAAKGATEWGNERRKLLKIENGSLIIRKLIAD